MNECLFPEAKPSIHNVNVVDIFSSTFCVFCHETNPRISVKKAHMSFIMMKNVGKNNIGENSKHEKG